MPENKSINPTISRIDKYLTDDQIDAITEAASEMDNGKMQNLKNIVEIDPDAELELVDTEIDSDTNKIDLIAKSVEDMDLDIDFFDAANSESLENAVKEKMISNAKSNIDLDDDEAYEFIKLIDEFRKNHNIPNLYSRLPTKIQNIIGKLMYESKIPIKNRDAVSQMVLNEFISTAEVDAAFVDLEKALNESLNIPSMIDMYGEHTREMMDEKIPEMIEKIKDEEPEKAEMLSRVKDAFDRSYSLVDLKNLYENNSSVRKSVRRSDIDFRHALESINEKNTNTRFKMYDAFEILDALKKVLCDDPFKIASYRIVDIDGNGKSELSKLIEIMPTEDDIKKFCILISCACKDLNAEDIIDASYMYYLTKNIIMLRHTQEAKTNFSAELINNICDIIALIRNKEAEFYAQNPRLLKSKRSKKSNSTSTGKK